MAKKGKDWLPKLIENIALRLSLHELVPVFNLGSNYIVSGFQCNSPIILKLSLDAESLKKETLALQYFAGHGVIKVITGGDGFLLLERAVPGISLKSYFPNQDIEAVDIACEIMKRLHQAKTPVEHDLPHIKDWLIALNKDWNIPQTYLKKARDLRNHLLATSGPNVLLHGDLHHDNILQNGDDWVVIRPLSKFKNGVQNCEFQL